MRQLLRDLWRDCPYSADPAWKLDRLSRSLKDLLHIMERIQLAGAGFRSLTEAIDTTGTKRCSMTGDGKSGEARSAFFIGPRSWRRQVKSWE